jgi:DNA-binding response OmpR family regulator
MQPGLPTGMGFELETAGIPLRVLVVESLNHTSATLEEIGTVTGMTVESERDARVAVERLRDEQFDVIVVHLPPPQMSPAELFRDIVAIDIEKASRIIFLVNDLGDSETRKLLTGAGRPFLTRPVAATALYDLVVRVGMQDRVE